MVSRAKRAYDDEVARGAETRRRSEDLFRRTLGVLSVVGAIVWTLVTLPNADSATWWGRSSGYLAVFSLVIAFIAITKNLGRSEVCYALGASELLSDGRAVVVTHRVELQEYLTGALVNEQINDIQITRLHFSHACFLVAVLSSVTCAINVGVVLANSDWILRPEYRYRSSNESSSHGRRTEQPTPPGPGPIDGGIFADEDAGRDASHFEPDAVCLLADCLHNVDCCCVISRGDDTALADHTSPLVDYTDGLTFSREDTRRFEEQQCITGPWR